jgi:hypothetical protein
MQHSGGGTEARQEQSTSHAMINPGIAESELRRALLTIDNANVSRAVADVSRAVAEELPEPVRWDTDTAMLTMMNDPTQGPLIREQVTTYIGSLSRTRQLSQAGLTGIFSQRYLASHIWSEGRVR